MYYGERLNSISHLVGAVLALVGLGALLTVSIQSGDAWRIVSFSVFGFTLVLLYTMSTLYHSFNIPRVKSVFKVLDHISIYLLIAGSYTPFILVLMRDPTGWLILSLVWGLALLGIASEVFLRGTPVKVVQMILYLAMGWACSIDLEALARALSPTGYNWLLWGGLAYTGGVVFYLLDKINKLNHAHGIWHFFVLMGSICHFIAIMGYV
ncbi:MAG: hemolysin III family protein [Alcanivoracaceae bacterium]|jgi:hemolysin III|nr:hemolysin III family protein [Alcanivoracaceae bacterium]